MQILIHIHRFKDEISYPQIGLGRLKRDNKNAILILIC